MFVQRLLNTAWIHLHRRFADFFFVVFCWLRLSADGWSCIFCSWASGINTIFDVFFRETVWFCFFAFQIFKSRNSNPDSGFYWVLNFWRFPFFLVRGSKKIHTRCFLGPNRKRVELDVVHDFLWSYDNTVRSLVSRKDSLVSPAAPRPTADTCGVVGKLKHTEGRSPCSRVFLRWSWPLERVVEDVCGARVGRRSSAAASGRRVCVRVNIYKAKKITLNFIYGENISRRGGFHPQPTTTIFVPS